MAQGFQLAQLVAFPLWIALCSPMGAQVIYPTAPAWAVVDGQKIDLTPFGVTAKDATGELQARRRDQGTGRYRAEEIQSAARSLWCQRAVGPIEEAARRAVARNLGAVPSDAEVELAFRAEVARMNVQALAEAHRQRAAALESAFDEVLIEHKPVEEAWARHLKGRGVPLAAWQNYLSTLKTEAERRDLIETQRQAGQAYLQERPWRGYAEIVMMRKIEERGDLEIAREDAVFAQALKDTGAARLREGKPISLQGTTASEQMKYIQKRRAEWLDRQLRGVTILTSELSLGETCGISWLIRSQPAARR